MRNLPNFEFNNLLLTFSCLNMVLKWFCFEPNIISYMLSDSGPPFLPSAQKCAKNTKQYSLSCIVYIIGD